MTLIHSDATLRIGVLMKMLSRPLVLMVLALAGFAHLLIVSLVMVVNLLLLRNLVLACDLVMVWLLAVDLMR